MACADGLSVKPDIHALAGERFDVQGAKRKRLLRPRRCRLARRDRRAAGAGGFRVTGAAGFDNLTRADRITVAGPGAGRWEPSTTFGTTPGPLTPRSLRGVPFWIDQP